VGGTADAAVAHRVEDFAQQLARGGDLGDVLCLLAAAAGDGVLELPRLGAGGLALDRLGDRLAQHPRALPGHVATGHLDVGYLKPQLKCL
jgi:hypothetical protein